MQQTFTVSPDFKTRVTEILNTKKFASVFPFMNLINREGFVYTETELNGLIQFLGEFQYNEVSELFKLIPALVQKNEMPVTQETPSQEPVEQDA
jgi:hypothetical protein